MSIRKHDILNLFLLCLALPVIAGVPEGYYSTLEGKSGDALREAVKQLGAGHTEITYGSAGKINSWVAFETSDVIEVEGRKVWRDMYSNNLVYLPAHAEMNIEHSVANSWWGGKNGSKAAYCDLFHLNPSDQKANNIKDNWPPGIVGNSLLLDNGILKVGKPTSATGGGSVNVFEPADHFKGDFARAYFYVFATYPDIPWESNELYSLTDGKAVLAPWAAEMLLAWHEADPVDSQEMARNEAIYAFQKNRNPFIDLPGLAVACFGSSDKSFSTEETTCADRPVAPAFPGTWLRGLDTYSMRWWDGKVVPIDAPEGNLFVSIDGGPYEQYGEGVEIDDARSSDDTHVIRAYSEWSATRAAQPLRSPVATLSLSALHPTDTDYSQARWEQASVTSDIRPDEYGIILSANTNHVMSTDVSGSYLHDGGFVRFGEAYVTELPDDAALVRLHASGQKYSLAIHDTRGNFIGYWKQGSGNKNTLDKQTATLMSASIDDGGHFIAAFDNGYSLQFNASQPRFTNYTTSQTPVLLYNFKDFDVSTICPEVDVIPEPVVVEGNSIRAPEGMAVYDINGRRLSGDNLPSGIYIVAGAGRSVRIIIGF